MVHDGYIFVAGIHPSRTWMSGSFEFVRWDAHLYRLDLDLYSHPKAFWGNGVRTRVNSKWKMPSTGRIFLRGGSNPRPCIKQHSEPNALPIRYSGLLEPDEAANHQGLYPHYAIRYKEAIRFKLRQTKGHGYLMYISTSLQAGPPAYRSMFLSASEWQENKRECVSSGHCPCVCYVANGLMDKQTGVKRRHRSLVTAFWERWPLNRSRLWPVDGEVGFTCFGVQHVRALKQRDFVLKLLVNSFHENHSAHAT